MTPGTESTLQREHHPDAVRRRLADVRPSFLPSAILGGIDGGVTTFAVVAASVGGDLSVSVILILGFANLLADGFSMAVSNYNASKSQVDAIEQAREIENRHIDEVPEGEREEVRQILERKGLQGPMLEDAVRTITSNRQLWVDTMVAEEWGLPPHPPSPVSEGFVTFASFAFFGFVPLLPFLVLSGNLADAFRMSIVLTAGVFAGIGWMKGYIRGTSKWRSAVGTLATGGTAAVLAYLSARLLRTWFGAA